MKNPLDLLFPPKTLAKTAGIDDTPKKDETIKPGADTTAASVIIALTEAWEMGKINEGDTVVLAAFGSGFTWGSAIIKW